MLFRSASCKLYGTKAGFLSRHRALTLTFKPYPDNADSLVVNHINGIGGDDRLDNLELVTRSENNTHSYINDLKSQHMRILTRNVLTGVITEYYSICECARSLGYATDETIRYRLRCRFGTVFQDGLQFKLKKDKRRWVNIENPQEEIDKAKNKVRVIVTIRDCRTMEVTESISVREAAAITGMSAAALKWRLDNNIKRAMKGFQIKYSTDTTAFPDFDIIAKNADTGDILISSSVAEMSLLLAIDVDLIYASIKSNGKTTVGGYCFFVKQ